MLYASLVVFLILYIYDMKHLLHMAQQNLYNDDHRFLKWTLKDYRNFTASFKCLLIVLVTFIVLVALKIDVKIITNIYFIIVTLIILLLKIKENKTK